MAKLLSGTRIYGTATVDTQLFVGGNNAATSTTTGALQVIGGAGIGGDLYVGGKVVAQELDIQYTTVTTTLVITDDVISTYNTTPTYSTATGALKVGGGVGVGGGVFVGGTVTATLFVGNLTGVATTATLALLANTATLALLANTATLALTATTATQLQTQSITTNAAYYPTFVSANNASATGMSEYTTSSFTINPSTGLVTLSGGGGVSVTGSVTATLFVGNLTGVATTATNATNVAITADTTTNTAQYITFVSTTTGFAGIKTSSVSGLNYIASSGYHGIGIATPTAPLQILASVNSVIKFTGASSGQQGILYSDLTKISLSDSTFGEAFTITPGTGALTLTTNATDRITVDVNGQVKIIVGTASTSSTTGALVVTGGVGVGGSVNIGNGNNTVTTATWEKWKLVTVGTTAAARQGSDSNGLNFTSNALWTGSAWQEDDTSKKKFAYIQHLGNGRHEFRSAATGTGISWITSLALDDTAGTFSVPLTISSTAAASSTITGALIVSGGAGIGGSLYVGGSLTLGTALSVTSGGTGVATLTGVAYGNGTSAFTAATGAQISTALGSTNISGSAANVTGIVATNNGGTGLSSWTAGDLAYYSTGTTLTKLAIGASGTILSSSGTAPQWTATSGLSVGTATKATNIAGGSAGQIPYQSAADTTAFSSNLTWNNSLNTFSVTGLVNAYVFTRSGNINSTAWTTTSPILHSAAGLLTDTSTAASATVSARVGASLFSPNFAATNASVTITDAINLYVQEPVANSNITITNNWSLWSAGNSFIGKSEKITTSLAVGSYSIPGTTGNIIASGSLGVGVASPGYKVDVAGSIMATQGYSDVSGTNSALRLLSPGGASSWQGSSTVTGAIKIKLPTGISVSNTMLRFTVKVYTYDGLSFDINCGGYTYTTAPGNWINTFAYMTTQSRGTLTVRFGYDSGTANYCIYIGELATVWNYCNVFVTDFQAGYSSYGASTWNTGWAISWEASAFANVTATQTAYAQLKTDYVPPAPTLTNTYIGFGNSSNLMTGSSSLTWDGTTFKVTGAMSVIAPNDTTVNFSNVDSDSATYTNRGSRVLTSNGSNWAADGKDPILTLTRNSAGTTRGQSIGLLLHNENAGAGAFSPLIGFSAVSNSGSYNSIYAAIMGKKTGANSGVDTNWNAGELHFYTASTAYMADTPTATLSGSGWGIGVTPSAKLHLGASVDGETVSRISGSGSTGAIVKFADVDIGGQGYGGSYMAWARGGSYDNWFMLFTRTSGNVSYERLRITSNGGVSFGTGGTNYGSSGQLLQSNADAPPTWINASTLNVATAGTAVGLVFADGPRDLSNRLPNWNTRSVYFDFINASTAGTSGNYAGVMTFAPWTGTTASTGDGSYQLAFGNASGTNASGQPTLRIRTGIDSTWNSWYTLLHAGNVSSYTAGAITNFTAATSGNPLTPDSPATLDAVGYVNSIPSLYSGGSAGTQTDGGLYVSGYSTSWYHEIFGDFRTGSISVRGKNSGTWQPWRSVPCVTISDTAPSIYNNGDLWWQSSTGRMKVRYSGASANQWVDVVPVIDTSLFFSKSGGAISGPVSINGTLDVTGNITATAEITAYYSDRRLKTDVVTIENALVKVKKLNGVTYRPNELAKSFGLDTNSDVVGLFADEVEEVLPQAVKPAPFDVDENGNSKSGENYKTIQYEKVVPLLVEAIKEQQSIIEAQQAKIDRLMKHLGLED